jgi:predicted neuraminidase
MRTALFALAMAVLSATAGADDGESSITSEAIFPPEEKHNHASCLVELANGDLLVAWYRGSGERKADDVEILGSRLKKGATSWEPRFPLADTPGYPDCNPALFAAPDGAVWMWWPTILDHRWEGALLKYRVAKDPGESGPPEWTWEGVQHVTPQKFGEAVDEALKGIGAKTLKIDEAVFGEAIRRSKDELYQRLGWMPRVRPIVLPSGRWLLPLYTDTFSASIVGISDDQGKTWTYGTPMIGFGNIQPSLVRRDDGTIVAFMRENGPRRRIRLCTSTDEGKTWGPVTDSELPNPGAGVDAIRLANGHWALIYNDTIAGRHSLAVSLSDDEGRTWKWTRHVERTAPGGGQFHYPSILQTRDGAIHASYTRRTGEGATIQHARFDEDWLKRGDPAE